MKHISKCILSGILVMTMLASVGCSAQKENEVASISETVAEEQKDSNLQAKTQEHETMQNVGEGSENMETQTQNVGLEENPNLAIRVAQKEHYIFELSDKVTRSHVYYQNRFGIELAGDLYSKGCRSGNTIPGSGHWASLWRSKGAGTWRLCQ